MSHLTSSNAPSSPGVLGDKNKYYRTNIILRLTQTPFGNLLITVQSQWDQTVNRKRPRAYEMRTLVLLVLTLTLELLLLKSQSESRTRDWVTLEMLSHRKSQYRHLNIANQSYYYIIILLYLPSCVLFLIFQLPDNGRLEVSLLIMTRNCFCGKIICRCRARGRSDAHALLTRLSTPLSLSSSKTDFCHS